MTTFFFIREPWEQTRNAVGPTRSEMFCSKNVEG